jgi:hypothetical protein
MNSNRREPTQRFNALHVVEAELEHLDWATRQLGVQMFDARYWRRRVLEVKGGFELTHQQSVHIEQILRRLDDPDRTAG